MEEELIKESVIRNQESTCDALEKIGLYPMVNEDGTVSFQFQGEHFYVQFGPKIVVLYDFEWLEMDVDNKHTADMLEAIKFTNGNDLPTFIVTSPNKDGIIKVSLEYRYFNSYSEEYPEVLKGILYSFFSVKEMLWKTYSDYLFRKGKPSRWKTPEIGYVEGSNTRFSLDYYLKNIKDKIVPTFEINSPEDEEESKKDPGEGPVHDWLMDKERELILNDWMEYLIKLGCQPIKREEIRAIEFGYQGQHFLVTFPPEEVDIVNYSMFRIPVEDTLTKNCFNIAVKDVYKETSPKIVLSDPREGYYWVNSCYNLFIDFNFHDKNYEYRNLKTLKRILDSFITTRNNLIYYTHHYRERVNEYNESLESDKKE